MKQSNITNRYRGHKTNLFFVSSASQTGMESKKTGFHTFYLYNVTSYVIPVERYIENVTT